MTTPEDDADMAEAVDLVTRELDAEVVERDAPTKDEAPGARVTKPTRTPPKVTRG